MAVDPRLVNENILAIDIGKEGGLVWNRDGFIHIEEMPEHGEDLWRWITNACPAIITAEDVHAFKDQGIVSTGTLMEAKGMVRAFAIASNAVETKWIQPIEWIKCYTLKRQKHMATKREWKKHLAEIAKEMVLDRYIDEINLRTADAFLIWNHLAAIRIGQPLPTRGLFK